MTDWLYIALSTVAVIAAIVLLSYAIEVVLTARLGADINVLFEARQ